MMFKGTSRRPSPQIINTEFDALGAQSNAFTSHEVTGYWAKAEKKNFKKLVDILADMYLNPLLPKEELEKERGVILQEISMYEDEPRRQIRYVINKLMYGDAPAGRTILGPAKNIKKFSRKDFENYRNEHYVAKKTIVVVAGDLDMAEVRSEIAENFKNIWKNKKVGKE